jgi:hypothetical protein
LGFGAVGFSGVGAPLAVTLAATFAFTELLVGTALGARSALAARGAITPAAGIVVFVVVAGHELVLGVR